MKKILIISYYAPPCNLTAAERILSWAVYLKEYGYYPIIVTRNWDIKITKKTDLNISTGDNIKHEKHDNYEIIYLPYKASLRERIMGKYGEKKYKLLRKILSFFSIILQNFTNKAISYSNLYNFSKEYLLKHKDIKLVCVSASPYVTFRFGYLLNKQLNIKWIADYRDDWNTNETYFNLFSPAERTIKKIFEPRSEKKWLKTASFFTTVSEELKSKIENFINIKGYVVANGFMDYPIYQQGNKKMFKDFTIIFSGTLYQTQDLENFIKGFQSFIETLKAKNITTNVKLKFIGTGYDIEQKTRIENASQNIKQYIEITERISKDLMLEQLMQAHLLINIAHKGLYGIPSSKLYEYIGTGKPIMAFLTNKGDIIESILSKCKQTYLCYNPEDVTKFLLELYQKYLNKEYDTLIDYSEERQAYSRKNQTKLFAQLIDTIA